MGGLDTMAAPSHFFTAEDDGSDCVARDGVGHEGTHLQPDRLLCPSQVPSTSSHRAEYRPGLMSSTRRPSPDNPVQATPWPTLGVTHRSQLVKAGKELIEGHDQFLGSALGGQAGESLDVSKQDAGRQEEKEDLL